MIAQFAESRQFPIIPCNLCGSQENLQRKVIKKMLQQWESATPGRLDQILRSLKNVVPSHLADTQLFGFADLVPMSESESSLCSDSPLR